MNRTLRPILGAFLAIALLALPAASAAQLAAGPAPATTESAPPPSTAPISQAPVISLAPDAAAADAPAVRYAELPNFHRVDDKLSRGGEPKKGGMARLKELGIDTVLDLRWERGKMRAEEAEAKAAGLRYFAVPMYGLLRPTEEQIEKTLAIIADPANGRVFVHCERGSDRTGVVVGCYRVATMKWTAERAIEEAMELGMYRTERAKRTYIKDFSARMGE
jgi:tyrosine-protein phosphatase SIW14